MSDEDNDAVSEFDPMDSDLIDPDDVAIHIEKGDAVLNIRDLNRDLRDKFHAFCITRGRTMTEVVTTYMYNCVTGEQERIDRRKEAKKLREERRLKDLRNPRKKKRVR